MKRKQEDLSGTEMRATLDTLYTAAAGVRGRDAMKLFLKDLLTPSERLMLGRRIIIARMLMAGSSYNHIGAHLRVGKATISRIHTWLLDQLPGFENAVKEMEKEFDRRAVRHAARDKFTFAWLKKRYPIHFLFFPNPKIKHAYGQY